MEERKDSKVMRVACAQDVLYKRDESGQSKVEKLLEEDADFTRQKTRCQEFLRLLDEAAATVREVQDFRS